MKILFLVWCISIQASSSTDTVLELASETTPTRALCNVIVEHYFQSKDPEIVEKLRPYLERKLEDPWHGKRTRKINALAESRDVEGIESKEIKRAALRIINAALEDALKDQDIAAQELHRESNNKFSKKEALLITSGVTILTTLIGAAVTFAVTFSSC